MSFFWRYFPAIYTIPFIFATIRIEQIAIFGELARWGVMIVGCGLLLWRGLQRKGMNSGMLGTADWMIGAFVALFLVSSQWSIEPALTLQRAVSVLLLLACSLGAFWRWVDDFSPGALIVQLLRTLAALMLLNLTLGAVLAPESIAGGRFHGFFANPNNIGMLMGLAMPLAFSLWLRSRRKLDMVVCGVFAGSLLLAGTRSGLLGFGVAAVIILATAWKYRPGFGIAVTAGLIVGGTMISQTEFFAENILREETLETGSNRTEFWELGRHYISHRPSAGHGFGIGSEIHDYYGIALQSEGLRGHGVMSSYYGFAVQIGWPATWLLFGALWGFILWNLLRHWNDPVLAGYLGVLTSGLIISIVEPALYSAGNVFSFLFWITFMLAVRRVRIRHVAHPKRKIRRRNVVRQATRPTLSHVKAG